MTDLDMINRDPNNINDIIKVSFEDVLAEPDGAHSCDCVWRCSSCCFNCSKNCCYRMMTTLCGLFIALYWGCEFAFITFEQVWCTTPCLRVFSVYLGCYQKLFGTFIACFLTPICETCGLIFSKISITRK
ncbi:caveolin-1-like [Ostrea edulis]|uniref:caveolin-1-like n=1 Tax=Ostrea edulis TaxID=37623 RepID=UPI0024AFB6A3|nr:caveolin-1-like [Ostrea edulis]XP_048767746.2 caveolin-1-like [Ostrea edulis]XP_048767747.2 caveolin-1-like [Ostrea edulis]